MYGDDDDIDEPLSTRQSLERSDHRKQEREVKKLKKDVAQTQMQKLKRDMLKKDVHGSIMLGKDGSIPKTFGPKSHEQKDVQNFQTSGGDHVTPDDVIDREEEVEQVKKESKEEQQSEPG